MKLLLDTCVFLWLQLESAKIPPRLLRVLLLPETRRFISVGVSWEIAIKWSTGKLKLPLPPEEFVRKARAVSLIEAVPIFESTALQTAKLPRLHNDPFDRIQISQAIEHSMILVTPDDLIKQYAVRTIWD